MRKCLWLVIFFILLMPIYVESATISVGGGGGYDTVQDEGIDLPKRTKINFIGGDVDCYDDGIDSTDCTIGISQGFVNVKSYGASGVDTTTTINMPGGLGCSNVTQVTLADASSFAVGQGIAIPGAGIGDTELVAEITAINGNTVTINPGTSCTTTVADGTTVYHDDTAAIVNAINTGYNVFFPTGIYNITSGITIDTAGQILKGAVAGTPPDGTIANGPIESGGSVISVRRENITAFLFNAGYTSMQDLTLVYSAASGSTSGAMIQVGDGADCSVASNRRHFLSFRNLIIRDELGGGYPMYEGIRVENVGRSQFTNIRIQGKVVNGIVIDTESPCGDNDFYGITVNGVTNAGLLIHQADYNKYTNFKVTGNNRCFVLTSSTGHVGSQTFVNPGCEDMDHDGWVIGNGNSTYQTIRTVIVGGIVRHTNLTSGTAGVVIDTDAEDTNISGLTIEGVNNIGIYVNGKGGSITGVVMSNTGGNSLVLSTSSKRYAISGIEIYNSGGDGILVNSFGNSISSAIARFSSGYGVNIRNQAQVLTIGTSIIVDNNSGGIYCDSQANGVVIVGNLISGNTGGNLINNCSATVAGNYAP